MVKEGYDSIFGLFDGFDRFGFPAGITRVTAGYGGEALLLTGSEKTVLLDCGMAYCADSLTDNLTRALNGRGLDYILLSHTHYDHIGALPFIRKAWPAAITLGAAHADKIFNKRKAIETIVSLSENAWRLYGGDGTLKIPGDGFVIDRIARDGDRISLGDREITVMETKGHTDCSLAFALEPQRILFLSESTGVIEGPGKMHVSILKSYKDTLISVKKCRNYRAKRLVSPHYGLIPEYYNEEYWESFLSTTEQYKDFLYGMFRQGLPEDEILKKYEEVHWDDRRQEEQPKEAFMLNAENVIRVFRKEFDEEEAASPEGGKGGIRP